MKKKIIEGKAKAKKGGLSGNRVWQAHRLEGEVENKAIKPKREKKKKKL